MAHYDALTTNNSSFLKRFSHRRRFECAATLLSISAGDAILDYGTGDGYMLHLIAEAGGDAFGFEPDPDLYTEAIGGLGPLHGTTAIVSAATEFKDNSFDKICCLEVLEHLPRPLVVEALSQMKRLLARGGFCVISVPIEIGISGFAKNIARLLLGQAHEGTTFRALMRIALGLRVERESNMPFISSHVGFDHRELEQIFLDEGWQIMARRFSPCHFSDPF